MPEVSTTPPPDNPSDADLLRIELGVIWQLDEQGRLPGPESMVIAVAADGLTAAVSRQLPAPLAQALLTLATTPTPQPPDEAIPETPSGTAPESNSRATPKTPLGAASKTTSEATSGPASETANETANEAVSGDAPETTSGTTPGAALGRASRAAIGTASEAAAGTAPETAFGATSETAIDTTPGTTIRTTPSTAIGTAPGTAPGTAIGAERKTAIKAASGTAAFGVVPGVLEACRALLGGDGVAVSGGPSYLVTPPVRYDVPVDVLRSDEPAHAALVRPLRAEGWDPDEWDELVSGGEGAPWAMIVEDGEVAALCHTARLTPAGAEAGTWTAPAYRGRGYAAATTAVWAGMLPGLRLFYSTSADNHSSQRVAQRLGLRPLGWFWKLTT